MRHNFFLDQFRCALVAIAKSIIYFIIEPSYRHFANNKSKALWEKRQMLHKHAVRLVLITMIAWTSLANAKDATVVRMGVPAPAIATLPIFVAMDKGYFAEEGIDLKINFMRGGSEIAAALIGGSIDILNAALSGVMIVRDKGLPIKVLSGVAGVRSFALVVDAKRHANINNIEQVKGLKIATSRRGSDGDLVARVLLDDAKLNPERDVTLIQIGGYDNHLTAIEKGDVDGSMMLEPFVTLGVKKGAIKPIVDLMAGQGPEAVRKRIWTVIGATEDYIRRNPNVSAGLVRAIVRADKFIQNDDNGTLAVAQKYFPKIDAPLLREIVRRNAHVPGGNGFLTEISSESIDLENKFLVDEKMIKEPVRYQDVVATDMKQYWYSSR